ncbi:MAG: hypothetical protein AB1512_31095 [Thermodesulfobacteriota bacterium]
MTEIGLAVVLILLIYLLLEFRKEKRRNRILQSFVAGLIKGVSDYVSRTDTQELSSAADFIKIYDRKFPIPYYDLLQSISREFQKDFWVNPYWRWLKKDRNLFYEEKYANDGFNMIYWDFFDNALTQIRREEEKKREDDSRQAASLDRRNATGSG